MKLYGAPESIALATHIALVESGMSYEFELVDIRNHTYSGGRSYLQENPKRYVPFMVLDDGTVLTESIATLLYVSEHELNRSLSRGDDRYRVIEWLTFVATEIHQRLMRTGMPGLSEEMKNATMAQMRERFGNAAARLADRNVLVGDNVTVADILLYNACRWLQYIDIDIRQWPQLADFYNRMADRPAVRKALAEEGIQ
jgi:glutathione S-transferase